MEIESKKKTYNKRRKSNKRSGVNEGFIVEAGLDRTPFDKEDIVIVMNIYRGQNLCLVADTGRVVR